MKLERTTFSRSREGEYFDARELTRLTGRDAKDFLATTLKELADNALDACESAGVQPRITVELSVEGDSLRLCVSDNGPGILPETVEGMLNFSAYVSDKQAYRSPTRGAQGNALKTVLGMPHALGSREPRVVVAQGIRHSITSEVDPAGGVRISHDQDEADREPGTTWMVAFPADARCRFDLSWWAKSYAFVNPHASFETVEHVKRANSDSKENVEVYKSSDPSFDKWLPTDPTPPHWYDISALSGLIHSHISRAENGGRDLPIGEFARQFRGLTSSAKARKVRESLPGISYLSDLKGREEEIGCLLDAMREHGRAPKHKTLGRVGERHFRECIKRFYGIARNFRYAYVPGYDRGLPFVFELAVAATLEEGGVHHAINHSPTQGDPLTDMFFMDRKIEGHGLGGFAHNAHANAHAVGRHGDSHVAVVTHLIHPAPSYTDKGKSKVHLQEEPWLRRTL